MERRNGKYMCKYNFLKIFKSMDCFKQEQCTLRFAL